MTETERLKRCGIGIRGVAMAIDSVVWFALFFVSTYAIAAATGQVETTPEGTNAELEGTLGTVGLLVWLSLGIGYHALLEWRSGKTLGKYLVGIKVVEEDDTSLSLGSSLVRNLLRIVDWLPLFYLLGIVLIAVSEERNRLGDRVGGTAVVRT
ncbi:RDD family protein [Salinarchaeum laminariae]|uniref:RDD family protein n=1 Tax=Salinarchaeum laminariae TaxID=869888 RepID=UPI0020BD877F|nr:RDD family protein [Salinarchaeum laminariae]